MPWSNWSLKLHIRLRTISLLISSHNTQVYCQWMPYSFVWLYLLKCVFTCSIFVDSNTNFFLSVLGDFRKDFVFTKTEKFQKTVLSCFGDLVASHPSRIRDSSNSSTLFLSIVKSLRGSLPKPFFTISISVRGLFDALGSS